ncbi:MAG: signal peptidase I [Gemmatimonadetes bacterium]|nr:signal peptidase I [Gemmatimonadota bacterium]
MEDGRTELGSTAAPGSTEAAAPTEARSSTGRDGRTSRRRAGPSIGRWMWEWTKSIFVALVLFITVRTFMVEAFQIPTGSMENTLLVGDFLLVNKMVYGAEIPGTDMELPAFGDPARGDVIVFEPPPSAEQPPRTNYVKRIVGVPGDTLEMRRAKLLVNGVPTDEPYVKPALTRDTPSAHFSWQGKYLTSDDRRRRYRPTRDNWGPLVVPSDNYFVMGDNRSNSEDSRYWGFVPKDAIKGRPMVVYYSYDRKRTGSAPWLTEIRWDRIFKGIR